MTANEFIFWQCGQVRSTITRRGVGFVSLSSADDGASLLARFLAYKARSAHASSSSGRSPISYSFQPAEKETGIFWPCQKIDRKSTRLNSSHSQISYAVFCLKKKNN